MTEEESVRQQLQNLQTDLLEKFEELKSDNEKFKLRLQRIEEKLGIGVEIQPETSNVDDIEEEQEKQEKVENEVEVVEGANIDNEEEDYDDELGDEEEEEDNDDEGKPEVKLEKLPTSTFKGFCFRPLAGWRNSSGMNRFLALLQSIFGPGHAYFYQVQRHGSKFYDKPQIYKELHFR